VLIVVMLPAMSASDSTDDTALPSVPPMTRLSPSTDAWALRASSSCLPGTSENVLVVPSSSSVARSIDAIAGLPSADTPPIR
jgi:hypothetical protein